jgi:hypothetical protein
MRFTSDKFEDSTTSTIGVPLRSLVQQERARAASAHAAGGAPS